MICDSLAPLLLGSGPPETPRASSSSGSSTHAVWPIDLGGAARVLGLTIAELVEGFESSSGGHEAHGVVAKRGENVDFSVRRHAEPMFSPFIFHMIPGVGSSAEPTSYRHHYRHYFFSPMPTRHPACTSTTTIEASPKPQPSRCPPRPHPTRCQSKAPVRYPVRTNVTATTTTTSQSDAKPSR